MKVLIFFWLRNLIQINNKITKLDIELNSNLKLIKRSKHSNRGRCSQATPAHPAGRLNFNYVLRYSPSTPGNPRVNSRFFLQITFLAFLPFLTLCPLPTRHKSSRREREEDLEPTEHEQSPSRREILSERKSLADE